MIKKILYIVIFISAIENSANCQTDTNSDTTYLESQNYYEDPILLIGKRDNNKNVLRWALPDAGDWLMSIDTGYIVERIEYIGDTLNFDSKTYDTVRVATKLEFENYVKANEKNSAMIVAASSILGESSSYEKPMQKSFALSNRHTMALMAADLNRDAAKYLGLRYEDEKIELDMSYAYFVYSLGTTIIDTLFTSNSIIISKSDEINDSININISENDGSITLFWDREPIENAYTAFDIEKIIDNRWIKINKQPYVNPVSEDPRSKKYYLFNDSTTNYTAQKYRIRGIDAFADYSPFSNEVIGQSKDLTPPSKAEIQSTQEINQNTAELIWKYPKDGENIQGFIVTRGAKTSNVILTKSNILPVKQTSFIDTTVYEGMVANYYVGAIDTAGNISYSYPKLLHISDKTAPSPPTGIKASIDSFGLINLIWNNNIENDIDNYNVFMSNHPREEFSRITGTPLDSALFTTSVTLNTLTEDIYFKVTAVDYSGNTSDFSKIITVSKPDTIPPTPPVFHDYKVSNSSIELFWHGSSSKDVQKIILERRQENDKSWVQLNIDNVDLNYYIDKDITPNKIYNYRLFAVDDVGNKSIIANTLKIKPANKSRVYNPFRKLHSEASKNKTTIKWEVNENPKKILIYRKKEKDYRLFKSIDGSSNEISIFNNKNYAYAIQAIAVDGRKSPITKTQNK